MTEITDYIAPAMILSVFTYGIAVNTDIFDAFIEGASEGLKTTFDILPALICLMTCIGMFKASGCMEMLTQLISPVTSFFGFPDECIPLIFIRPLSGSGALSVYDGIIAENGADSFVSRVASTMMGSTETTFYTVAVYFGAAKIKKSRYAVPAALTGDMLGWIASVIAVRLFF